MPLKKNHSKMYYITKEQYAHDIGVLNCHIVDLSTKIAELEAILNQLRVPPEKPKECTEYAPLKENETLRGEKGKDVTSEVRAAFEEDVTKEVRAAFEVVKTLSEDYLMSPPKECPEYIPLNTYLDAGGQLRDIKRVKIGIRVRDLLRIEPYLGRYFECFFYGDETNCYDVSEIMVYKSHK